MRGNGFRNLIADNIAATSAQNDFRRRVNTRPRMCWKCQKDKPFYGGELRMMDGFGGRLARFICKDCIEAREKK
jgi:hypothetical protein